MSFKDRMKVAYTLLPPPLSALPAKYWTSVSLLMHSYAVGVAFSELIELVREKAGNLKLPERNEAFILGFLHDLTQKMAKSSDALRTAYKWIFDRLVKDICMTPAEARRIAKVLETNPAETIRDPIYPVQVWKLLRIADLLQGSSDVLSWGLQAREVIENEFNIRTSIRIYNIGLRQPFLKDHLWRKVEGKLREGICNDGSEQTLVEHGVFAVTSTSGLLVVSKKNLGDIALSWDEIIGWNKYSDSTDLLSRSSLLRKLSEKCPELREINKIEDREERKKKKQELKKNTAEEIKGIPFTLEDKLCFTRNKHDRTNMYDLLYHYYGGKLKELNERYLPFYVKSALQGITIEDTEYATGPFKCPMCGAEHKEGFVVGLVGNVGGVVTEKWNRFLLTTNKQGNLNRMLNELGNYRICPLCMADILIENREIEGRRRKRGGKKNLKNLKNFRAYYSFGTQAPLPLTALWDLSSLAYSIVKDTLSIFNNEITDAKKSFINKLLTEPEKYMENVERLGSMPHIYSDYGANIFFTHGGRWISKEGDNLKLRDKLKLVAVGGILAYYGIYPIYISVAKPLALQVPDTLISYETIFALYDYSPSDKRYGDYTPYVSALLATIPLLYEDKDAKQIEELLEFTPKESPLLLLYSNPKVYSYIFSILSKFLFVEGDENVKSE